MGISINIKFCVVRIKQHHKHVPLEVSFVEEHIYKSTRHILYK